MGHAEMKIQDALIRRTISMDEYWMPFTPNRDFKHEPKMVVRAEGMYLWNERGDKLIDASSGLRQCGIAARKSRRRSARSLPNSTSLRRSRAAIRSSSSWQAALRS